ncbi:MAG: dihydroneopterin aldolase [Helicobacteraceae bacterium]|nr:dihydroneopterin aldolase [Helicobacteraceae bacterium]
MEFLELVLILISVILIMKKPQKEKLAFNLVIISWVIMVFMYAGHKSSAFLTIMNL